jgi:hypothetical protein
LSNSIAQVRGGETLPNFPKGVKMTSKQKPLHYHLVTGEIFFRHKSSEEVGTTRLNAIIADPQKAIPVKLLGAAQQTLQLNFFKMMGDDAKDTNVLNCVIYSFSHLGYMTSDEFHASPDGTKLQEVAVNTEEPATSGENKLRIMPPVGISLEQAVAGAEKTKE